MGRIRTSLMSKFRVAFGEKPAACDSRDGLSAHACSFDPDVADGKSGGRPSGIFREQPSSITSSATPAVGARKSSTSPLPAASPASTAIVIRSWACACGICVHLGLR
eukprot:6210146-Pleurochrysis_carterae.AAC.2